MTVSGILTEKGNLDTDVHMWKTACGDEDRDQGGVSPSQETPKTASKPQKVRGMKQIVPSSPSKLAHHRASY